MEIYSVPHRKGSLRRIEIDDVVDAVFLMAKRAKEIGSSLVFFPEAGGLLLKYIFQHGILEGSNYNIELFSSKITALTKSPLSKQICAILSPAERNQYLTRDQIIDFKKAVAILPQPSKNKLIQTLDIDRLRYLRLGELITRISSIGLYIPSEDRLNWVKEGIIPSKYDPRSYSPEDSSSEEFQDFRKKIITHSLNHISDIAHDVRPLFNIILSQAHFTKRIHRGPIYVIDEAISRGRSLNTLEVVFKAFNEKATWRIGALFCPIDVTGYDNVDFILSNDHIPPFSNRFDLIGNIVVESDMAFVKYNIEELATRAQKSSLRRNQDQVTEYFKRIRAYVHRALSNLLQSDIVDVNDIIRLLHFVFVCNDTGIIKRCLDLNPVKINGLVEEVSFYVNIPNPLDPMPMRKSYKDTMLYILEYINGIPAQSPIGRKLHEFKRDFQAIRRDYELMELESWAERYRSTRLQLDNLLRLKIQP